MSRRVVPPRRKEEREREENIARLAATLDIGPKALTKLKRKHGLKLEALLEKWHKETRERPRFLAKQQGRVLREQYVETAIAAIDDVEAVPEDDQRVITTVAHARWETYEKKEHAVQRAHKDAEQLAKLIRDHAVSLARSGEDPIAFLAEHRRLLADVRRAA